MNALQVQASLDQCVEALLSGLPPETHRAILQRFFVTQFQRQLERLPLWDREVILLQLLERNFPDESSPTPSASRR